MSYREKLRAPIERIMGLMVDINNHVRDADEELCILKRDNENLGEALADKQERILNLKAALRKSRRKE